MRLKKLRIGKIFIIFCLVVCAIFLFKHQSRITADKMFSNMSYLSDSPYFSENVSLINGRYEWNYTSIDNVFLSYSLQYEGQYIYGDFNHDKLKDAAVIYTENSGGNASWRTIAFLISDGKKLVHRASGELCDRAIVNSIGEQDGKVIVDWFSHQDGDCMAGPTKHVKSIFEYGENKRWIEGKQISAKSVFDPIILMFKPSLSLPSLFDLASWQHNFRQCGRPA